MLARHQSQLAAQHSSPALAGLRTARALPPRPVSALVCPSRAPSSAARGLRRAQLMRAAETEAATSQEQQADVPPPGCSRYSIEVLRPLGMVLEEDRSGNIYVAEVAEGGNAARTGQVQVGDQLIATSGVTYTTAQTYGETEVRGGERVVRLNVRGEKFDTVMAAISSHNSGRPVTLEFQRCKPLR